MMKPVHLISSLCENNGIGSNNTLPWKLKKEMAYFTKMSSHTRNGDNQNAVIMGRKTWESIPKKYKPLQDRLNVVISKSKIELPSAILHYNSVTEAVKALQSSDFKNVESIWVIGGHGIYKEAIDEKLCDKLFLTKIKKTFDCDVFFPEFSAKDYQIASHPDVPEDVQEENGIQYQFEVYEKKD